jgi:hypothetical protein
VGRVCIAADLALLVDWHKAVLLATDADGLDLLPVHLGESRVNGFKPTLETRDALWWPAAQVGSWHIKRVCVGGDTALKVQKRYSQQW